MKNDETNPQPEALAQPPLGTDFTPAEQTLAYEYTYRLTDWVAASLRKHDLPFDREARTSTGCTIVEAIQCVVVGLIAELRGLPSGFPRAVVDEFFERNAWLLVKDAYNIPDATIVSLRPRDGTPS